MKTQTLTVGFGWVYEEVPVEVLRVGDKVRFTCNGRGRGGHYYVTAIVTNINRKTFDAIEADKSYHPGTLWRLRLDSEIYILRNVS